MSRRTLTVVAMLVIFFCAWGAWSLLSKPAQSSEDAAPPQWEPQSASNAVLEKALPSWAELMPDTGLDPASGLPTPIRDPKTGLVYCLVPAGETIIGDTERAGYSNESAAYATYRGIERKIAVISTPYYLGREEVTWQQFRKYLEHIDAIDAWHAETQQRLAGYADDHPVVLATRVEAAAFAAWAGGRLPTEVEWEYAAKGRVVDLRFPWGASRDIGDARLAVDLEEILAGDESTFLTRAMQPCGTSQRDQSWCGIRDLAGNAAEFMAIPWRSQVAADPLEGLDREDLFSRGAVVRGGSWASSIGAGRCTQRDRVPDGSRLDFISFRVRRAAQQESPAN